MSACDWRWRRFQNRGWRTAILAVLLGVCFLVVSPAGPEAELAELPH